LHARQDRSTSAVVTMAEQRTQEEVEEIRSIYFAEDVVYDYEVVKSWSIAELEEYFDSGGKVVPDGSKSQRQRVTSSSVPTPPLPAATGLHALSCSLIGGKPFDLASIAGRPALIMNVASR